MPAIATIASAHPKPPPNPKDNDWLKLYSFVIINNDPPRIAQFTVISGKKIPNELYSDGENFSTTISTNCTKAAMVDINMINLRKVKSIPKNPFSPNK